MELNKIIKAFLLFASSGLMYGVNTVSEADIKEDCQVLEAKTLGFRDKVSQDPILRDVFRKNIDSKEKYGLLTMEFPDIDLLSSISFVSYDKRRKGVVVKSISGEETFIEEMGKTITIDRPIVFWYGPVMPFGGIDCKYFAGEVDFKDDPYAGLRVYCQTHGRINFKNLSKGNKIRFVSLFLGDRISLDGARGVEHRVFGLGEYSHDDKGLFISNPSLLKASILLMSLISSPRYNTKVIKCINHYKAFGHLNGNATRIFDRSLAIGDFFRHYREDMEKIINTELGMYNERASDGRLVGSMILKKDESKISNPEIYLNGNIANQKKDPFENQLILKNLQKIFDEYKDSVFPIELNGREDPKVSSAGQSSKESFFDFDKLDELEGFK